MAIAVSCGLNRVLQRWKGLTASFKTGVLLMGAKVIGPKPRAGGAAVG